MKYIKDNPEDNYNQSCVDSCPNFFRRAKVRVEEKAREWHITPKLI
jgi:hypothetical protein